MVSFPLTWMVSTTFFIGFHSFSNKYSLFELSLKVILYQSKTSEPTLVTPHATSLLNPMMTPGEPGIVTPYTFTPGAVSWF